VLTACQSLPLEPPGGPAGSLAGRRLLPACLPLTERTPCISVTAPQEEAPEEEEAPKGRGASLDSGYHSPVSPALPTLNHLDVCL
jgi:hypothetical protein